MIENIITSRTKRRILEKVFESGEKGFYLREVSRLTAEPPSAVNRELKKLEAIGFVLPRKAGKTIVYMGNRQHPYYPALEQIFQSQQAPVTEDIASGEIPEVMNIQAPVEPGVLMFAPGED